MTNKHSVNNIYLTKFPMNQNQKTKWRILLRRTSTAKMSEVKKYIFGSNLITYKSTDNNQYWKFT